MEDEDKLLAHTDRVFFIIWQIIRLTNAPVVRRADLCNELVAHSLEMPSWYLIGPSVFLKILNSLCLEIQQSAGNIPGKSRSILT